MDSGIFVMKRSSEYGHSKIELVHNPPIFCGTGPNGSQILQV